MQSQNLNQSLNESLQAKYPHLELAILPLSQVNKDNESKRIDSEYFKKEYQLFDKQLENMQTETFKHLTLAIKKGIFDISPSNYRTTGIPFLRVQNISNSFLDVNNCVFISKEYSQKESKTQLEYGDLALSKVGSVGRFCFITETSNASQNVSAIQVDKTKINPHFLFIVLLSKYGQMQLMRRQCLQVQAKLELDDIRKLKIPLFPKPFQLEIEKLVKQSQEALEDSKRLYKEAQELLYKELELDFKNPLKSLLKSSLQAKKASELAIINDISKKYPHLNISVRPLSKTSNIRTLALNGTKAKELFLKYCKMRGLVLDSLSPHKARTFAHNFAYNNDKNHKLDSTPPANPLPALNKPS